MQPVKKQAQPVNPASTSPKTKSESPSAKAEEIAIWELGFFHTMAHETERREAEAMFLRDETTEYLREKLTIFMVENFGDILSLGWRMGSVARQLFFKELLQKIFPLSSSEDDDCPF